MLRVNGCMVYEDDAFFDACDALGLLVWQDFMFANMDYPASDAGFMASVREEARQQLARWQAHPSLAVICGNSEAEQQAAMWGAPREAWAQPLFDEQLAALAGELCPGVTYWPSSAHGGAFPHQNNVGTTSYYGVGAYLRPMEDARRAGLRFATECLAFANVPPPATLARMPGGTSLRTHHPGWKARAPRDLGAGWDFEDVRDHYLQRLYGVDPVALRSTDHERYLQLSRAVSAEVIAGDLLRMAASRVRLPRRARLVPARPLGWRGLGSARRARRAQGRVPRSAPRVRANPPFPDRRGHQRTGAARGQRSGDAACRERRGRALPR